MSEVAPGIFLSEFVDRGTVYVMDLRFLTFTGDAPDLGVAIHPDDWAKFPPAERERFLDEMTRRDAARGVRRLQEMLSNE